MTQTFTITPTTHTYTLPGPTATESSTKDSGVPAAVFAGVGGMMVALIALILIVILLVIFLVRKNRHQKNR